MYSCLLDILYLKNKIFIIDMRKKSLDYKRLLKNIYTKISRL